jgi:hypothetical protein
MGYVEEPEKKGDKKRMRPDNPEDRSEKTGSQDIFRPEEHRQMIKRAEGDRRTGVETTGERVGETTPTRQGPEVRIKPRKKGTLGRGAETGSTTED